VTPESPPPERPAREPLLFPPRLVLFGILAIGAGLRFALLGQNSVYVDETFVVRVTQLGWGQILPLLRLFDAHPPLYYLVMKAWVGVAGTGEAAIRIPSAVFSVVSIALTYALMRRFFPEPVSLLGALLMSLSPHQVIVGQIARMYPLLEMLFLGSVLAFVAAVEHGGLGRWAVYTVLGTLMVYTHYLGLVVVAAQGVWVACNERRCIQQWLASVGVIALLYLPWLPSLWSQVTQGNGWPWYRGTEEGALLKMADLLGLFAFGGSLFGMASYFTNSTLEPLERLIVLLPFLVVLWYGIRALSSDRRTLALLGFPAVLSLGGMLIVSIVRPMFYTRWFSFLFPVYVIFLTQGIFAIAAAIRGRRDVAVALLAAGLVLYSLPVLDRYYFESGSRPFQWRAAASLVQQQARPGDLVLYLNNSARSAFMYYFHGPSPWFVLPPGGSASAPGDGQSFSDADARQLASRYARVWLIATPPFDPHVRSQLQALQRSFRFTHRYDFNLVWVDLLEPGP
jgi:4-amino-4-deoxy-L-arabinose transferase-like glycosyltransferase